MKHTGLFFLSAASLLIILSFPVLSVGAVRIELKNGRSITAEGCRDSGDVFVCSKMGGSFEIEKSDVGKIGKISDEALSEPAESGPYGPGDEDVKAGPAADPEKPAEKTEDRRKEAEKKMEGLQQRKLELSKEREQLIKERDALREDTKKAPDWMPEKRYDELQKRNADFDAKIKKFNAEVNHIEDQEKQISEETGAKSSEAPQ